MLCLYILKSVFTQKNNEAHCSDLDVVMLFLLVMYNTQRSCKQSLYILQNSN